MEKPAVIGQRVFGKRRAARAHDAVADLEALGIRSERGDLAGPFHAEHGAGAAGRAMGVALAHAGVGAIEATGADPDQHLRAFRLWLSDVGNRSATRAVDISLHELLSLLAVIIPQPALSDERSCLRAGCG
ncbi:hypothetical protein ACVWXM_000454 [Bradyrhizobium sp. GM7.3]